MSKASKNADPTAGTEYSMDSIKLEALEHRRQLCSDIVRQRKRKLAELLCITTAPYTLMTSKGEAPKSGELPTDANENPFVNKMLEFFEMNDLSNGRLFKKETLVKFYSDVNQEGKEADNIQEVSQEPPLKKQKTAKASETPEKQSTHKAIDVDQGQEKATAPISQQQKDSMHHVRLLDMPLAVQPTEIELKSTSKDVTLIDMINNYANDPVPKRTDAKSGRDLNIDDVSIENLLVGLLPEGRPHKIAETRSLTELYYHQQTLPLPKLLLRAHKTLSTNAYETSLVEGKVAVLHSRIEELKRKNSWSLRQPRRFIDPFLQFGKVKLEEEIQPMTNRKTHWDSLVSEGKWLSLDIKQTRRWKQAQCVMIAQAVHDFWTYGKVCCIKRARIIHLDERKKIHDAIEAAESVEKRKAQAVQDVKDEQGANEAKEAQTVKELQEVQATQTALTGMQPANEKIAAAANAETVAKDDPEGDGDDADDDFEMADAVEVQPQDQIEMVEEIPEVPNPEDIINEILETEEDAKYFTFEADENLSPMKVPDISYEEYLESKPAGPFKMFADMSSMTAGEKSVVENLHTYAPFDAKETDHLIEREHFAHISSLLPPAEEEADWSKLVFKRLDINEKKNVRNKNGLFGPFRRINILKPPHPPKIEQLNIRIPTIWLPQDDKYLIKYVSEFSFNWDVISSHLSPKSTSSYTSNIERRTPWQCFERYIQLNDKFQFTDMRGLFAERAKKWLESAHRVQTTTKRRISPLGVGTESIQRGHRRLRWASMFEAMKRVMKKRESEQKPSTKTPKFASEGKRNDTPSPADLSLLKFERDKAMQESYNHANGNRLRGRQLSDQSGKGSSDKLSASASQQRINPRVNSQMQQLARATTPNGTPLTSDQIQKLMQLKRQRQQSQRQAMLLQQQQMGSKSNSGSGSNTPQLQHANLVQGGKLPGSPVNIASAMLGHGTPEPQAMSPSGQVPTPEQLLQRVNGSGESQGSPTPKESIKPAAPSGGSRKVSWNNSQVQSLVAQIRAQNPNMDQDSVMRAVANLLHKAQMSKQQKQQQQQQQQ